ncbi:MAG: Che9cp43 [Mycobacterium sp.]|nr:Che9cp43 [Mycobacterium sp.]
MSVGTAGARKVFGCFLWSPIDVIQMRDGRGSTVDGLVALAAPDDSAGDSRSEGCSASQMDAQAAAAAGEELVVDEIAARRLITSDALCDGLRWTRQPRELAEHLWVDEPTLQARMRTLDRSRSPTSSTT